MSETSDQTPADRWTRLHEDGQDALDAGRYEDAERHWLQASAIAEGFPSSDARLAQSCHDLARLYSLRARYDLAAPLMRRELEVYQACFGPEHPLVCQAWGNLGMVLGERQETGEAVQCLARAAELSQKLYGPQSVQLADTIGYLAVFSQPGPAAEALMRQSLHIKQQALGSDHPKLASSIGNLANLLTKMGRWDEAVPLYERTLALNESRLLPDDPRVADTLFNLVRGYLAQNRLAEAERLMHRLLRLDEANLGPRHPRIESVLETLAQIRAQQDDLDGAQELWERVVALRERRLGPAHVLLAQSLSQLSEIYARRGLYRAAEQLLGRALQMTHSTSPEHPLVPVLLLNLADLAFVQEQFPDVEQRCEEAMPLAEAIGISTFGLAARIAKRWADALDATGRPDEADRLRQRAQELLRRATEAGGPFPAEW